MLDDDQKRRDEAFQQVLARTFSDAMEASRVPPKEIAAACGVSEQAVSNWKRTGKIRTYFLPVIAERTGWSLARLMTGRDEAQRSAPASIDELDGWEGQVVALWRLLDPEQRDQVLSAMRRMAQTASTTKGAVSSRVIELERHAPPPPESGVRRRYSGPRIDPPSATLGGVSGAKKR